MCRKSDPLPLAPFCQKAETHHPFLNCWKIWKAFGNLHILFNNEATVHKYSVVYVHSFLFDLPSRLTIAERHNLLYSSSSQLNTIPEKIRYYRHKNSLTQKDVATALNMNRTVYQYYEQTDRDYFPLDILEKIAAFYNIPTVNLMDNYHLFLYHNPGMAIKQLRKQLGYTQEHFAKKLHLCRKTVRDWEKGCARIPKETYSKLFIEKVFS